MTMKVWFVLAGLLLFMLAKSLSEFLDLLLTEEHIPYYFYNNPSLREKCLNDKQNCPYSKIASAESRCWGYENECPEEMRMSVPQCPGSSRGWVKDKASQLDLFWRQADFGYVKERRQEMKTLCQPEKPGDSMLQCSKYLRYCRTSNLYLDFTGEYFQTGTDRYREDVLGKNKVGGYCQLDKESLRAEGEHKSPLQSWFAELEHYSSLNSHPFEDKQCDVVIDKPTYFIKLDAGINLYHHFCDFINLYASQHINNSFSTDVLVVMWDTSPMDYSDFFDVTWKAFTKHPVLRLGEFAGKRVCFREAVFSLLARMRYGLYYNMPLVPGCHGSSLFRAFSQHILHRLNVTQEGPILNMIRITLLIRNTAYRKILNQDELIAAMKTVGEFEITVVDYNPRSMSFLEQLKITHNSDIFIGIHGAGLTHVFFQPDWGVLFELYNCEDAGCYRDLTLLRGLKYITWDKSQKLNQEDEGHHPTLGAHAKFTNYGFDVREFMRLILGAADYIVGHKSFWEAHQKKYRLHKKDEL